MGIGLTANKKLMVISLAYFTGIFCQYPDWFSASMVTVFNCFSFSFAINSTSVKLLMNLPIVESIELVARVR